MKGTPLGINPAPLFDDVTGPGIEPVGGEFQPSFATVHPGGGAHLFSLLHSIFVLKAPSQSVFRGPRPGGIFRFNENYRGFDLRLSLSNR
jgi:hypothetical protein